MLSLATNALYPKGTQTNEGLAPPIIKDEAAFFFSEKEFTAKEKLEAEIKILTEELQKIARINPSNPNDSEPIPAVMDTLESDKNGSLIE